MKDPTTDSFDQKTNSQTNNFSSTASFSTISSLLTLFSKFFSSFLRSTCMLSVSYKYLALGEVYLPLRAAFPNYPTLRKVSYCSSHPKTGLSPSLASYSKELMAGVCILRNSIDYNSMSLTQINILGLYLFTRRY